MQKMWQEWKGNFDKDLEELEVGFPEYLWAAIAVAVAIVMIF